MRWGGGGGVVSINCNLVICVRLVYCIFRKSDKTVIVNVKSCYSGHITEKCSPNIFDHCTLSAELSSLLQISSMEKLLPVFYCNLTS